MRLHHWRIRHCFNAGLLAAAVCIWFTAPACGGDAPGLPASAIVSLQSEALRPADPGQIRLQGFLGHRIDGNRRHRLLEHVTLTEDRLLEGFRNRPGRQTYTGEHAGKFLDAALLAAAYDPADAALRTKLHRIARGLIECQVPDGYLGTYLPEQRWQRWDVWVHKYVLMGLLAYYRDTGDPRALQACRRIGDLLASTFMEPGRSLVEGDLHAGLANTSILQPICLLYEYTGDPRYLKLAQYVMRQADEGPGILRNIEQFRTVQKVGQRKAYEMMSNYLGLIEYWRSTGERRALGAARLAWQSIRDENRYITGGIEAHETFCPPHQLETTGACTETCVQAQWFMLNRELLRITGEPCFADEIHRHVYNHLLAAQRPDGSEWCYFTTMEGEKAYEGTMTCCSSNGARAIALLPTIACMTGGDRLVVNLYETSVFRCRIAGVPIILRQTSDYPWDGRVQIVVEAERPVEFKLQLLVPFFAGKTSLSVEDRPLDDKLSPGTYATVSRRWEGKTKVDLDFTMPVTGHEQKGRWALVRGPQVLAFDEAANGGMAGTEVRPDVARLAEARVARANVGLGGSPGERVVMAPAKAELGPQARPAGLVYRPFSEAGTAGGNFGIFLPRAARVARPSKEGNAWQPRIPGTRFETSRPGKVRGSFVDGDERTTYLTNNGQRHDRDWFAAVYAKPIMIDRVLFIHGRFLPGGGWWATKSASGAPSEKPLVEIRRAADGPWEPVARIDDYPDTTQTDHGGVRPHSMFIVRLKPVRIAAIRISGAPSCGNDPQQNLVSCSEVDVRVEE